MGFKHVLNGIQNDFPSKFLEIISHVEVIDAENNISTILPLKINHFQTIASRISIQLNIFKELFDHFHLERSRGNISFKKSFFGVLFHAKKYTKKYSQKFFFCSAKKIVSVVIGNWLLFCLKKERKNPWKEEKRRS